MLVYRRISGSICSKVVVSSFQCQDSSKTYFLSLASYNFHSCIVLVSQCNHLLSFHRHLEVSFQPWKRAWNDALFDECNVGIWWLEPVYGDVFQAPSHKDPNEGHKQIRCIILSMWLQSSFDTSICVKTTSEYLRFIYYSIAILYWAVTPRCKRNARHLQWVQKKMVAVQSGFRETSMIFPPLRGTGIIKLPIFGGNQTMQIYCKIWGILPYNNELFGLVSYFTTPEVREFHQRSILTSARFTSFCEVAVPHLEIGEKSANLPTRRLRYRLEICTNICIW